ncbi:MAG: hypothetical protein H6765_10065 [Candidatus Peribacteria bacterium]|nr:MAG: hypothetical protein H6765_10065 [Candidatus Peribacteria bacterium]
MLNSPHGEHITSKHSFKEHMHALMQHIEHRLALANVFKFKGVVLFLS